MSSGGSIGRAAGLTQKQEQPSMTLTRHMAPVAPVAPVAPIAPYAAPPMAPIGGDLPPPPPLMAPHTPPSTLACLCVHTHVQLLASVVAIAVYMQYMCVLCVWLPVPLIL